MIIDPNDKAAVVLYGEPTINDEQRADLYDAYYRSPTAKALARQLTPLDLHPAVENKLLVKTSEQRRQNPKLRFGRS
jgi:hypothetical protein